MREANGWHTEKEERLLLGWGLLTAWGLVSLSLDVAPMPGGVLGASAGTSLASVVGCALLALVARVCPGAFARGMGGGVIWALAIVTSVGSVANQVCGIFAAPVALGVIMQVIASIAYVILMYEWFYCYREHDPQIIESAAIQSTVVCALVCLAGMLLRHLAAVALLAVLPLASAWCLTHVNDVDLAHGTDARREASPAGVSLGGPNVFRLVAALGIGLCAVALAGAGATIVLMGYSGRDFIARLGNMGGLALAAGLVLWCVVSARKLDLQLLFRLLCPLGAVGMFLMAMPAPVLSAVGYGLCMAGQWALYVFIWIYAAEWSHDRPEAACRNFVVMRAAFDGGGALAGFALMGLTQVAGVVNGAAMLPYLLLGALVVLVFTVVLPLELGDIDGVEAARATVEEEIASMAMGESDVMASIDARAHHLARTYCLSEREAQILVRLLRGYSTASIRNELMIAKGTVDTYIQRIYRKCNVHTRQELVELAEGRHVLNEDVAPR